MLKKAQTDMCPTAFAVSFEHVTKTFSQWQRDNTGRGILRNLVKPEKKTITALDDVSFTVGRGEFVAYAGPNGAGKSTTMKLLGGMLLPDAGDITVLSMSPQKQRTALMQRLGILFGNRTELWWDHPVIQSFEWKKVVWDIPDDVYRQNLGMVTELLELGGLLKTFARELSLGQRMRADLAMLLLHSPEVLLLDEPTLGLDVVAKRQMIGFLKKINREKGVTLIVTSHDMDDLEEMAERILMISAGEIAFDGSFEALRGITGNLTRVAVTSGAGGVPRIRGGQLVSSEKGRFEYDVDLTEMTVRELLRQLSEAGGVRDVEIKRAPIEQVIAGLYREWAAGGL
ncbi:MAG: ATP-binding cassette domain-containing protein [Clostridiales bacterium]|nr:ATP-binding cassette domain-containing protein [Clostridiales bacterium]